MIEQDDYNKMMTVSEVSELLHIHPNTLRRWTEQGKLISYRITARGDRRFRRGDIMRFLLESSPYKNDKDGEDGMGTSQTGYHATAASHNF